MPSSIRNPILAGQINVFIDGELLRQRPFLVGHAHTGKSPAGWPRRAADLHGSGVDAIKAAQDAHQRAFAGTIVANNTEDFAGMDIKCDAGKRFGRPVGFDDASDLDERFTSGSVCL